MDSNDIRKQIGKPELLKLTQITEGLQVGRVMGNRVLVEPVEPHTKAEELERAGLLVIPQQAKEENTPRPSTGIVLQTGTGVSADDQALLPMGAMVMFDKYSAKEFSIDKKKYLILDTYSIACTLDPVEGKSLTDVVATEQVEARPDVPVMKGEAMLR